ncbi:MAG: cyclase family protein, partial [Anaerolineales bacterium]|nr:cyclase family protein [Anaerolineales bacterium]
PGTLSPPSVNMQLKITPRYRGPGYWRASSVEMVLHTGSHVDFSAHVRADGETAIDVPLDRFSGEALVVNVGPCEPSHGVSVADLEKAAPEIRPGDIVLVRTDWTDRMWGQFPDYYLTSPYCTPEAARWLVAKIRLFQRVQRAPAGLHLGRFCHSQDHPRVRRVLLSANDQSGRVTCRSAFHLLCALPQDARG